MDGNKYWGSGEQQWHLCKLMLMYVCTRDWGLHVPKRASHIKGLRYKYMGFRADCEGGGCWEAWGLAVLTYLRVGLISQGSYLNPGPVTPGSPPPPRPSLNQWNANVSVI